MSYSRKENNTTNYEHPNESNLWELHKAMEYSAAGEPVLRVNNIGGVSYNNAGNISASSDSFGRLRVSQPYTLFDSSLRHDDDSFLWDQRDIGNASSVHLSDESSILMTVSGNGDSVLRETKRVFSYQPGKSLLILSTFVMNQAQPNLIQRVGYYGEKTGYILNKMIIIFTWLSENQPVVLLTI